VGSLACGYAGHELQRRDEAAVFVCPCCGEDLYARKPMSYAEMEGLCPRDRREPRHRTLAPDRRTTRSHVAARRTSLWIRILAAFRLIRL
jgi:hypothetical protein